jgi:quercetin dioxygenase-like cupin family protein
MEIYSIHESLIRTVDPAITLATWQNSELKLNEGETHWGFVYKGHPQLYREQGAQTFLLYPEMFFCLPGQGSIGGKNSCGIVISCSIDRGLFSIGGPVEPQGRFAYIDGGTNSLLIPPAHQGAPCLNALYLPPKCDQTMHTHASYRIGVVVNGSGAGETPHRRVQLRPGMIFLIPPQRLHKFRTVEDRLIFVVFHPDSDMGFTHRHNLMLNRTLIAGISAANIPGVQTPLDSFQE